MNLNSILLDAAAGSAGGGMSGIIMIVLMIVIFYFFMIRPQQKKQKDLKKQREAMRNGDKVVTAGGIHGRIKEIRDTTILIEVAPGMSLKVDRGSVYPLIEEQPKANK